MIPNPIHLTAAQAKRLQRNLSKSGQVVKKERRNMDINEIAWLRYYDSGALGKKVTNREVILAHRAFIAGRESAQHSVHPTGLSAAQKEEVCQMIQSALDTGSA